MYKTSFRVSLFVIILMLSWTAVYAAGLGKLTLNSALGQPLNAEIDIVSTNSDDVLSLKASVATREAFAQEGIKYESIFSSIKISIEQRANGNSYIKLTSPQAVNDPFLNILIELSWASGRLLREYTVLLDPVEVNAQHLDTPNVAAILPKITTSSDSERVPGVRNDGQIKSSSKSTKRSANQAKETYGPVGRGETLSSIARQVLPVGVNLNQMLVALYRANHDAFLSKNMNMLKVGAILKIPEKREITAIDASTAKAEIKMQVINWHNYQGKIAKISRESPVPDNISQSDHGQITTSIDKKSVLDHGSSKEVLKLSSGAQIIEKDGKIPESTLVDRLRMMEEDATARNLTLQEANQRVAMLERSIENLKQLLELKDSVLAQAQIKADSISKTGAKPEIQPIEIINSLSEKDPKLDIETLQVQDQKASITHINNEAIIKEAEAKLPLSPSSLSSLETENQSLTDQILEKIEYIGASLVLMLLITLFFLKRRQNRLKEEAETDEIGNTNFSSAMQSRVASVAAAAQVARVTETDRSLPKNEEDDLTYENINSYSETLEQNEEFDKDPVYYEENTKHSMKPESSSELQRDNESLKDNFRVNNQVIDLNIEEDFEENYNRSIDSKKSKEFPDLTNEIDIDLSDETDEIKQNLTSEQTFSEGSDFKEKVKLIDNPGNLQEGINASDNELEINFDDSKQLFDPVNPEAIALEKDNGVDFEFANSDIDLTEEEPSNEMEFPKISDESLEFVQHQEITQDTMKTELLPNGSELRLNDINLNIEEVNSIDEINKNSNSNDKSVQWQEIETKLDLAKAYQDMDDKEGAKEMLEEVIRDGDAKQKKAARKLLKNLN